MSEKIKDGGPAFPVAIRTSDLPECGNYGNQSGPTEWQFGGMTLRDYFAAKAMNAVDGSLTTIDFATQCYRLADAMLEAREAKS